MINTTSMMTNEQYRNYLIDSIHIAAQMMYDMAEDLAAKSSRISNLKVTIEFDPEIGAIPQLTIERSHLPNKGNNKTSISDYLRNPEIRNKNEALACETTESRKDENNENKE